jgi:hypothetical protein
MHLVHVFLSAPLYYAALIGSLASWQTLGAVVGFLLFFCATWLAGMRKQIALALSFSISIEWPNNLIGTEGIHALSAHQLCFAKEDVANYVI